MPKGLGNGYGSVGTPAPPPAAPAAAPAAAAAEAAAPSGVTFPADFPNSVRHFLIIACVAYAIAAAVALFSNFSRAKFGAAQSLIFLTGAAGAIGYFAMMTGLGVDYKTIDATPRVVFPGRYLTQLVTQPLLLSTIAFLSKLDLASTVPLVVEDVLLIMAGYLGSTTVAPMKYFWWLSSVFFTVLISVQLLAATKGGHAVLRNAVYAVIVCLAAFQLLWVFGSEGSANLGLSPEVGLYVIVDVAMKVAVGLYLIGNMAALEKDGEQEIDSQQYV
eukprot:CAMPEP_0173390180 /NCGR_PEP_ID=MMETSP1356-20130122/14341_1 /TAXON_ID=77927 ORGANISM="Hemiselmis virescens, Strain PCC157" /NCGR_SAMPLE_ID=MMETSP1356 /ASSEMBLY_ACC=CAM_ASM_000847 /LENGTH=273 /DNA_ID=CAMNT_0014347511 /DNA_START=14 /DNA_END=835 /DNA_ORIENTATION=-